MAGVSEVENLRFRLGRKKSVHYESFFFDGETYTLYDCVNIIAEDDVSKPYIGKIIEISENPDKTKKLKLLCFFQPSDISNLIGSVEVDEKELFLASGDGIGVTNVNPLEAISGKCSIVCTSKDSRNPQPSDQVIKMADFVFHRTFDVARLIIMDKIDDTIAGIGVNHVFNQLRFLESCSTKKYAENLNDAKAKAVAFSPEDSDGVGCRSYKKDKLDNAAAAANFDKIASSRGVLKISSNKNADNAVVLPSDAYDFEQKTKLKKNTNFTSSPPKTPKANLTVRGLLDRFHGKYDFTNRNAEGKLQEKFSTSSLKGTQQTGGQKFKVTTCPDDHKLTNRNAEGKLQGKSSTSSLKGKQQTRGQKFEVTPCPDDERSKWFEEPSGEEIIQEALRDGKLVLLQNLDPSYTSAEVKAIVYHAFGEICTAKMIQQTGFLSPYTGQALVDLNTQKAAGKVLKKLEEGCLLLPNGRPLVASIPDLCFCRKQNMFAGHLKLDNPEIRTETKAVSTGHCSQPNTIEYDMALLWCVLQERFDCALEILSKVHEKEFRKLQALLKSK